MNRPWKQRAAWGAMGAGLTLAILAGVAAWPMTWKKSIGREVFTIHAPFGVKLSSFWYRDWMYRNIVRDITRGAAGDVERMDRVFAWVAGHIRTDVPSEWQVEDDHPLHVIIRGYGVDWQVTDVFTVLCAYAGVPARMARGKSADDSSRVLLAMVYLRGEWRIVDIYYRNRFPGEDGLPVRWAQLQRHPELSRLGEHQPLIDGVPYAAYFHDVRPVGSSTLLRPYWQMWWPRLWHELRQWGRRWLGGAR